MRLALWLSSQHLPTDDMRARLDEHLEQTRLAGELGFSALFSVEHYLAPQYQMLHQPTFLARVAAESGTMLLGTGISLVTLHNPVELADTMATLDVVTGGRAVFGVGVGYRDEEFAAFGVERRSASRVFEAKLDVIRRLWAGEEVDAEGPGYRLAGARSTLRPVQQPGPPVWVGANSEVAIRRAARLGDSWFIGPNATLDVLDRQLPLYRQARADEGKPPPDCLPLSREVFIDETRERAWERARPYLEAKYASYAAWGQRRVLSQGESLDVGESEPGRDRFLIGNPEEVLQGLLHWEERLGVDMLILRLQWPGLPGADTERALRLLGREVVPEIQRRAARR
jgi:alkanesulfonate monooxygenase SsuD/methylene tetrahydromethanopterin reductase-like flavin-dependent oxidoreductase (luciferase family)